MDREIVKTEFMTLIRPFFDGPADTHIDETTTLVDDLGVNSARLVDIMLEVEDRFSIRIDDEEAEQLTSVAGAVDLILRKKGSA